MVRRSHAKLRLPPWLHAYADLVQQRRLVAKHTAKPTAKRTAKKQTQSRVYRRLKETSLRDRLFYTLRQRKRDRRSLRANQPSSLTQRLQARCRQHQRRRHTTAMILAFGLSGAIWTALFVTEQTTLGGVPYRIIETFWRDKTARDAYFSGNNQILHDRLSTLGIEEDIKAYYRDRFDNEHDLDKHIHQIMFDRTGYVGEAYQVDSRGRLY